MHTILIQFIDTLILRIKNPEFGKLTSIIFDSFILIFYLEISKFLFKNNATNF